MPKKEAKGSPFYDSFVYARDKYGPEKYFVWYSDWYSTEDVIVDSGIDSKEQDGVEQHESVESLP